MAPNHMIPHIRFQRNLTSKLVSMRSSERNRLLDVLRTSNIIKNKSCLINFSTTPWQAAMQGIENVISHQFKMFEEM